MLFLSKKRRKERKKSICHFVKSVGYRGGGEEGVIGREVGNYYYFWWGGGLFVEFFYWGGGYERKAYAIYWKGGGYYGC